MYIFSAKKEIHIWQADYGVSFATLFWNKRPRQCTVYGELQHSYFCSIILLMYPGTRVIFHVYSGVCVWSIHVLLITHCLSSRNTGQPHVPLEYPTRIHHPPGHWNCRKQPPKDRNYCPDSKVHGPTWGPPGADRTLVGPMLAPWTLLSGSLLYNAVILSSFWLIYNIFVRLLTPFMISMA